MELHYSKEVQTNASYSAMYFITYKNKIINFCIVQLLNVIDIHIIHLCNYLIINFVYIIFFLYPTVKVILKLRLFY